jgi:glycosyltransferase involved in cell wall biosynthesis
MVKLSIIIPYFETYELTKKLMQELMLQISNYDVEVLIIDDGCEEYGFDIYKGYLEDFGFTYRNVKILHQSNMGVARTRNKGIDMAKGKYVAFIDCDDQITMDYVETLLDAIKKYDTDVINFNWYDTTEHIEVRKPCNPAPWKAIYKKETMPKFKEDKEYGSEDVDFQEEIESGKYSITYLDKLLYIYNSNREGSLYWKKTHREQ